MTAKILAISNLKGGVGKSSLTMCLASTLALRGQKTLVVDADAQGTAQRWSASAPDEQPWPTAVIGLAAAGKAVHREIHHHVESYDFIIVDCPPSADSPITQSVLLVADLCVIPMLASPPDAWAALAIKTAVEQAQVINDSIQTIVVLNQFTPNTAVAKEMAKILPAHGFDVAKTTIGLRTAIRESAALGTPLQRLGRAAKPAANEFEALADELLNRLTTKPVNG